MFLFLLTQLALVVPSWGASECTDPPGSFDTVRKDLFTNVDGLLGHLRNSRCLVGSCDPTHSRDGQCYTSTQALVLAAQGRFANKMQKLQTSRTAVKVAMDKYSRSLKAMGGEALPDVEGGFACKGTGQAGGAAMDQRKQPLLELANSLKKLRVREYLQEELTRLNSTFAADLAQTKPRPYTMGFITVHLPCEPELSQEFIRARDSLQASLAQATKLETYLKSQSCRLDEAKANFAQLEAHCGSVPTDAPTITSQAANDEPKIAPKEEAHGLPPVAPPVATLEKKDTGPRLASAERPVAVETPATLVDRLPVVTSESPVVKVQPEFTPEKPALKDPDKWGALSREEWKRNDDYKISISSNAPRLYSTDESLNSFLTQARSVDRGDYALRVQAAINATSMEMNGEGVGAAPSVYQDGVIGSRTRGAIDYYLRDPVAKESFLRNLQAYGISIQ